MLLHKDIHSPSNLSSLFVAVSQHLLPAREKQITRKKHWSKEKLFNSNNLKMGTRFYDKSFVEYHSDPFY